MQNIVQTPREIQHFDLAGALPEGCSLALNLTDPIGSVTAIQDGRACVLQQVHFTDSELRVFYPIVAAYPYYCPYDDLYASFYWHNVEKRDKAHMILDKASFEGEWDAVMRPIRQVLSRTRQKTCQFDLDILSILETGYVLTGRGKKREVST